jgi:hypothetical protein
MICSVRAKLMEELSPGGVLVVTPTTTRTNWSGSDLSCATASINSAEGMDGRRPHRARASRIPGHHPSHAGRTRASPQAPVMSIGCGARAECSRSRRRGLRLRALSTRRAKRSFAQPIRQLNTLTNRTPCIKCFAISRSAGSNSRLSSLKRISVKVRHSYSSHAERASNDFEPG